MSCSIASPQANETVNSLSVSVSVSYDITVVYSVPVPPSADPPPPPPVPPVPPAPPVPPVPPVTTTTWRVTCEIVGQPAQTQTVTAGNGTALFAFLLPSAGDYTVKAKLESVSTGGVVTPHGNDQQNPIHVTNGSPGGIIIILPPPPPPPPPPPVIAGTDSAKSGALAMTKKAAAASDCPPCPTPFVLTGTYPSQPADPTTGMVVQIYHIVGGVNEVIDYVSVPLLVGSTLASAGGGSIVVGNTFSTVFPPDARTPGRHFRLYLTGVLGKILYSTSGPVPAA
jgi:hypothetical protein